MACLDRKKRDRGPIRLGSQLLLGGGEYSYIKGGIEKNFIDRSHSLVSSLLNTCMLTANYYYAHHYPCYTTPAKLKRSYRKGYAFRILYD